MTIARHPRLAAQRGLTLIELMVGLLLGMLVTLMISFVMANAEGYKRSATNGSDAQLNGMLALYTLQREIQMAGYGLTMYRAALGCPVNGQPGGTALTQFPLVPVLITPGAAATATQPAQPDQLTLLSATTTGSSVPIIVAENHARSATPFVVVSSFGVSPGDLMLAVPPVWNTTGTGCSLFTATADAATGTIPAGSIPVDGTNPSNTGIATLFPATGYPAQSSLLDLGTLNYRSYAISNGNLASQDVLTAASRDVAPQIVMLRALYGKDTSTPADGTVDVYENTKPATAAQWQQVLTIRLAVVARSAQREKDVVTGTSIDWDLGTQVSVTGAATCTGSTHNCLSLTPPHAVDSDEWQHYRYKVYETVVPLRNMLWNAG